MTGSPGERASGTWPAENNPAGFADAWPGLKRIPGHPAAYVGRGSAERLGDALAQLHVKRLLVVHGRTSYERSGAHRFITALSGRHEVEHFDGVQPNPGIEQIRAGITTMRRFGPEAVIGIGGGSSLDVAKAIAVLAEQRRSPEDCLRHPEVITEVRRCALVLMPTTAGSGSEMTQFATVYVEGRKRSLDVDQARADLALIDQDLTESLPLGDSVSTGLDALAQSIESYWSVAATPASQTLALDALGRLLPALALAADTGVFSDPRVRTELAHGASLAGAAINISRTTAAHALSYDLTLRLGLAHGTAVALHLPWLLERHARLTDPDCRHPQGSAAVRDAVADIENIAHTQAGRGVRQLTEQLLALAGRPTGIEQLALPADRWLAPMTAALASGRAANNPCVLTVADLLPLLTE
ncbi:phosphonoacetaldehyde reductase [Streptomyces sp. AS58]|uniref:phosphonoacetaldehyde reductase n=1 Tax=Streptomyces sp. AS58 TaxID=1519489 RepID=UPI0006AED7EF|nr:phosphonoacetaldehyde reductase [Streptomyces sp. AS58]